MISRRITEHLQQQHWTAVFLDFVIVVAGVFIGLQVNNWNEVRKDRAEERRYYAQIVEDLRTDQNTFLTAKQRTDSFDAAAETILRAMRTRIPPGVTPGRFAVDIHHAGYLFIPHPSRRTYDELISTGNLGLLQNEAAKSAIATYYSDFDNSRQWDELLRSQQDRYWDATSGLLPRPVLKDAIRFREPSLSAAEAAHILAALRNRGRVEDLLISMAAHQERVRRDSEELAEAGRALIKQLEPLAK